jgi:hypothetical protein
MVKLFVLEDYEMEAWSQKYWINEMGGIVDCLHVSGLIVSEDGDALIHCFGSSQLFHIDSKRKLQQTLQWDGMFSMVTGFRFKGSLSRHAFLKRPRVGGRVTQPQFFHGL